MLSDMNVRQKRIYVVLNCIFGCLLIYGIYRSFCGIYLFPVKNEIVIPFIILVGMLLTVVCNMNRRTGNVMLLLIALITGTMVSLRSEVFQKEFDTIGKAVLQRMDVYNGAITKSDAKVIKIRNNGMFHGQSAILLIILALMIIMMVSVLRIKSEVGILMLLAVIFGFEMFYGGTPELLPMIYMIIGASGLIYTTQIIHTGGRRHFRQRKVVISTLLPGYICLMSVVMISIVAAVFMTHITGDRVFSKSKKTLMYQHSIERKIEKQIKVIENRIQGVMDPGHMTNKAPTHTGDVIMRVVLMEKPDSNIYFKGFTGDTYSDNVWETNIDTSLFVTTKIRKVFNMNYEGVQDVMLKLIDVQNSLSSKWDKSGHIQNAVSEKWVEPVDMQITYGDSYEDNSTMYVPYWADISGMQAEDVSSEISDSNDGSNVTTTESQIRYSGGDRTIERLSNNYYVSAYMVNDKMKNAILSSAHSGVVDSVYDKFVYQNYTSVPDGISKVDEYADTIETSDDLAVQCEDVKSAVCRDTEYSLKLRSLPLGSDYLEYFLFNQKKGYCEHYATAGTVLLREKGVPSRYVSGYCISPDEFQKYYDYDLNQSYYVAYVKDYDSHAWTDVYKSGFGWIPYDMTKGMVESESQSEKATATPTFKAATSGNDTTQQSDKTDKATATPKASSTPATTAVAGESPGKTTKSYIWKGIRIAAVCIIVFVLICAIAIWRRRRTYYIRYMKAENNSNKLLITAQVFDEYLRCSGQKRLAKMDDKEYITILGRTMSDDICHGEIDEFEDVLNQASFSCNDISDEEVAHSKEIMNKMVDVLWERMSPFKKIKVSIYGWRVWFRKD